MAIEDFFHPFKTAYRSSPAWFKRSIGQIYALLPMRVRYGKLLAQARRQLDSSQWWSPDQHRQHQWQQMKALLQHAYEHVPYYHRVLDDAGVHPDHLRSAEDWHRLPLLDKELIRAHKEEMVADNMRHRTLPFNTGGSTGRPLELYWERGRTRTLERAFMWRQWSWAGFDFGHRTAVIRGQTVREGLWHYDPIDKHLFVSAYNLSDAAMRRVIGKLRHYRPASIQAYPSTLALLATWMKQHNEPRIDGVKVLLCGSENLYPAQKSLFAEVFAARVYSWYGHAEACCLAGYCDQQDYYHAYSEYSYVELVDDAGRVVPWEPGARGELVGTSFLNNTMPFIRYRTGDISTAGPKSCSCGRNYPLIAKIEGRKQEYVVTADGRAIALTGLIFGQHWHAFARMKQVQLVQDQPGRITVRLVRTEQFSPSDEQEIRDKIAGCVGSGLDIDFDYVDYIEPTERGKHVFVKQSLPLPSAFAGDVDSTDR